MYKRGRQGTPARCPFCQSRIAPPRTVFPIQQTEFKGGVCECGAMFLVDPTGKNMGVLLADALSITGFDSGPESDYNKFMHLYFPQQHRMDTTLPAARVKGAKIFFLGKVDGFIRT